MLEVERPLHPFVAGCNDAAEKVMKIYLLMMLIGTILASVHLNSAPKQQSKSLQQYDPAGPPRGRQRQQRLPLQPFRALFIGQSCLIIEQEAREDARRRPA